MTGILVNWLLSALGIILVSKLVPGITVDSFTTALLVAIVLGVLNAFIKPVLTILTLPINILTLGLFTFVINAALIMLTSYLVTGFVVNGFIPALIGALVLWLISVAIHFVLFPISK